MPPAAAASTGRAPPGRRLAASSARPAAPHAQSRAATVASRRQTLPPASAFAAFAAAARLPPLPLVGSCAAQQRQSPALCRAGQQQPEFDTLAAAGSGPQAGTEPTAADGWPAPSQPQPQGLLSSVEAGIEAARNEVLKSIAELPQTARAAGQLLPQLHYPSPRFIARYTAQVRPGSQLQMNGCWVPQQVRGMAAGSTCMPPAMDLLSAAPNSAPACVT